jgi:hypothetical protein
MNKAGITKYNTSIPKGVELFQQCSMKIVRNKATSLSFALEVKITLDLKKRCIESIRRLTLLLHFLPGAPYVAYHRQPEISVPYFEHDRGGREICGRKHVQLLPIQSKLSLPVFHQCHHQAISASNIMRACVAI